MPMGWGQRWMTSAWKRKAEALGRDEIAAQDPARLMRTAPKLVRNEALLAKVRDLMALDGMEGGFSFLHLHEAILGSQPDWPRQLIGSCVASGDKETTAARMLAEAYLLGEPETIPGTATSGTRNLSFFAPFNYRAGRKLAGINGNGDGSLCLPHIKGKMQFGHLLCDTPGLTSDAFPEPQDERLYRQWGAGDSLLEKFSAHAVKFPLLESEPVTDPDSLWTLHVEHFKPANICSDWAFRQGPAHPTWKTRDGKPVYIWVRDTRDSWAHNMSRMGYVDVGGKRFALIKNTWGPTYHSGRAWFPISLDTDEQWLRDSECQTVGNIDMTDNPPAWPTWED